MSRRTARELAEELADANEQLEGVADVLGDDGLSAEEKVAEIEAVIEGGEEVDEDE